MDNREKIGLAFGICAAATITSVLCAGACLSELSASRKLLGDSTERIRNMSHVEIDQRVINDAVSKVVREKSGDAVRAAVTRVESATNADIQNRVRQAVEKQYGRIGSKVAKRIAEELESDTVYSDIRDEVVSQAVDKLNEKLSDELDSEIGKIGKVYQGIAAVLK
jgi:hypothetical protein